MAPVKIHLLDVGTQKYGDSILCDFGGGKTVLIDGAHSGDTDIIRNQINDLLDQPKISLLIVTHAHADHIGCIPSLVADGSIDVDWALVPDPDLGFGKNPGDSFVPPDAETDAQRRTRILAAALREEDRTDVPDDELREFLDSLDNLEADYRKFIQDLTAGGATVVRFGTGNLNAIQQQFNAIGFRVIGPNQAQINAAAKRIKEAVDFTDSVAADFVAVDNETDLVDAYRDVMSAVIDSGKARPGAAINMTSIVTRFAAGGRKFLFGGDMEFAHPPGISAIEQGVEAMRQAIRNDAPYDFYKLSHHGSWNGFDSDILGDLGTTRYLGISTGTNSPSHPAPKTLTLLRQNDDDLTWARTDRNGRCTFRYDTNVEIKKERGTLNNSQRNKQDVFGGEEQPLVPAPAALPIVTHPSSSAPGEPVEVIARVRSGTRVTITIDVDGHGSADISSAGGEVSRGVAGVPAIEIGRDVERLLFVTSAAALADNIGPAAGNALAALRRAGAIVLDTFPPGLTHANQVAPRVRDELRRSNAKGVVILGGYDVIPPQSLDCLPPELRRRVNRSGDPDNFIVWSDDIYGDREGDKFPEVPVSRIPDGRSAALVAAALGRPPRLTGSAAVRNIARPFADQVYSRLPGGRPILRSEATIFSDPSYRLDSDYVYLMLHGDYTDGSRYWGEETDDDLEAMNISNLPEASGAVVFTGCCWGALTVDKPAGRLVPGQTLGVKTPDASIALAFLRRGARAYVGCTGAHYSPLEEPYGFFGGPMHEAFWSEILRGTPPAPALFNAKATYMRGIPHGQTSVAGRSIEYKIARQFTCLGLGW